MCARVRMRAAQRNIKCIHSFRRHRRQQRGYFARRAHTDTHRARATHSHTPPQTHTHAHAPHASASCHTSIAATATFASRLIVAPVVGPGVYVVPILQVT